MDSTSLTVIIFVLTYNNAVPFSTVVNFGQSLKDSWSTRSSEPPVPHAEEQTIQAFAETIKLPLNELKAKLETKGIKVENETITLEELAKQNHLSPSNIYSMVAESSNQYNNYSGEGRGYGRKTIEQVCEELNISVEKGIKMITRKGIKVERDEKVKDVASRQNMMPIELVDILKTAAIEN